MFGSRTLLTAATLLSLLGSACAHHRDVRPGEGGLNSVELKIDERDKGYRKAMSQAEDYCDEKDQRVVVVSEDTQYVGSMDESTYKTSKTIAKVATYAGGAGMVFGGKNERNAGGVVGLGGVVGNAALGEGYNYQMKFRCQR